MSVFPSPARWLPQTTPALERLLVVRACLDIGLLEEPPGSNASPTINRYLAAVGSPLGSSWCAAAVAAWCRDAGAMVPVQAAGACQSWYEMGLDRGLVTPHVAPGLIVLYDFKGDGYADHMGVVVRTDPLILSVEGNTTLRRQSGDPREGVGCASGVVDAPHVLAYLKPEPVEVPT